MLRLKLLFICLALFMASAKADEGMWIPALLKKYNIKDMKKAGFKLSAEDVYDINKICLKDAIVGLGKGSRPTTFSGSGSFISSTGLVLTNHHTVVSYLHKHSSDEHNYLRDGFYASTKEEELPAKGLTLSRLIRMEDVTAQLKEGTDTLSAQEASRLMNARGKKLVEAVNTNPTITADIKAYFGGTQLFLQVYEVYRDVRIVAMPPLSLGKFGGENDNWKWPRQSADFGILRVYGNSNNESLKYSITNQPITPVNHLELSLKGYEEDDFAMVYGFPGGTKQYLTARAIQQVAEVKNYHGIKIRDAKMAIITDAMNSSEELWLKYSDYMAKTSNNLLRWKAESRGIEKLDLVNLKKEEEKKFIAWVNSSAELKEKYDDVIPGIESCVARLDTLEKLNLYVFEAGINGGNFVSFAGKFDMLNAICSRKNVNEKRLNKELRNLRVGVSNFFNDYDLETEKKFFKVMVKLYDENVGDSLKPSQIVEARKKYNGNFDQYIDEAFEQSIFSSKDKVNKFLKYFTKEDAEKIDNDPVFQLCLSYFLINKDHVMRQRGKVRKEYGKYHTLYLGGIREMKEGEKLVPDANRSLRVSFGQIKGINDEGVEYTYVSSLNDLVEKNQENSKIYPVPEAYAQSCKEAIESSKKTIPTCFISNCHTTGGNSGSAVLNAKGKLIGLNFDSAGNGLVGDYKFMPELTRQISVDIRYVRFVLENQLKAKALLEEWK